MCPLADPANSFVLVLPAWETQIMLPKRGIPLQYARTLGAPTNTCACVPHRSDVTSCQI